MFFIRRFRAAGTGFSLGLVLALAALPLIDASFAIGEAHADTGSNARPIRFGDFNGDGIEDVVVQSAEQGGEAEIRLGAAMGDGFETVQTFTRGALGIDWSPNDTVLEVGDFNGDGRDDLFAQSIEFGRPQYLLLADSAGRFNAVADTIPADHLGFGWSADQTRIVAGDFNGDGQSEILLQGNDASGVFYVIVGREEGRFVAHGQGWIENYLDQRWAAEETTIHVGDFNGDRRDDLLLQPLRHIRPGHPEDARFALILADADGRFTTVGSTWDADDLGVDWDPATHQMRVWDYDGDGIADVWLKSDREGGSDVLLLGTPNGFADPIRWDDGRSPRAVLAQMRRPISSVDHHGDVADEDELSASGKVSAKQSVSMMSFVPPTHGAEVVGSAAGSPGVSGGSAAYGVSVQVPPGRNGMQPAVALNYSSRGGNGELGIGWSLSAGSSIHRCAAIFATDSEGYSGSVAFDSARDRLCLDGQKLIRISGTYGVSGAVYRTELESFVRVEQTGAINDATASFIVKYKDGRTGHFGQGSNTALAAANNSVFFPQSRSGGSLTTALAWGVGRIEDRFGNRITFAYTSPSSNSGEFHLAEIRYTGNASGPGDRSVLFTWETRTDIASSYQGGGRSPQTRRLSKVQTKVGAEVVREYYLGYQYSGATGRSLMSSVEECAVKSGVTSCFKPTIFDWRADALNMTSQPVSISGLNMGPESILQPYCDVDGDGRDEMLFTGKNGSGTAVNQIVWVSSDRSLIHTEDLIAGVSIGCSRTDFNGDGRGDAIAFKNNAIYINYFSGNPFDGTTALTEVPTGIPMVSGTDLSVQVMDLDADGLDDLIKTTVKPSVGRVLEYWRNTTVPPLFPTTPPTPPVPAFTNQGQIYDIFETETNGLIGQNHDTPGFQDINGDGRTDITLLDTVNGVVKEVFLINTTPIGGGPVTFLRRTASQLGITPALDTHYHQFLDLNGDGSVDLLYVSNSSKTWYVQFNRGAGTTTQSLNDLFGAAINSGSNAGLTCVSTGCNSTPYQPKFAASFSFADVNNDGRTELLFPGTMLAKYCIDVYDQQISDLRTICGNQLYTDPLGSPALDYSLYQWNAVTFIEAAAHNAVTMGSVATSIVGTAAAGVAVGDIYGDGLTDFSYWIPSDSGSTYYQTSGTGCPAQCQVPPTRGDWTISPQWAGGVDGNLLFPAPDFLTAATDGVGAKAKWEYVPLSARPPRREGESYDPEYYKSSSFFANGFIDGQHHSVGMSMYAVERFYTSHGVATTDCTGGPDCAAGFNTTRYSYGEGVVNIKGRGFQGFQTIIEDDLSSGESNGLRTITDFVQKFPNAGMVRRSVVRPITAPLTPTDTESQALALTTNTWTCADSTNPSTACLRTATGTYVPYLESSVEQRFEIGSHPLPTVVTSSTTTGSTSASKLAGCPSATVRTVEDLYYRTQNSTSLGNLTIDESANWWLCGVNSQTVTVTEATCKQAPCPTHSIAGVNSATTVSFTYTAQRQVDVETTTTTSLGNTVTRVNDFGYDGSGNVSSLAASGTSAGVASATRTTTTVYETSGYFPYTVTQSGLSLNHVTTLGFNARHGELLSKTTPNVVTTLNTFDAFGRETTSTASSAAGALPTRTTTRVGCMAPNGCDGVALSRSKVTINQPGAPDSTTWLDERGRSIRSSTTGFNGSLWTRIKVYDAVSRVKKSSEPMEGVAPLGICTNYPYCTATSQFDILNRPIAVQDPKGNETIFAYTIGDVSNGFKVLQTRATMTPSDAGAARISSRWTDGMGRLTQTQDPHTAVTHFRYDAFNNPVSITDGHGNEIKASYNAVGHKLTLVDPDLGSWIYAYNAFGELTGQTDAKGQSTAVVMDNLGRMTSRTEGTEVATWTWDTAVNGIGALAQSLLTVAGAEKHKEIFEYDAFGRPKTTKTYIDASATPQQFDQAYDPSGRLDTVTYPQGIGALARFSAKHAYSANGYLSSVADAATSNVLWTATSMDPRGNLTGESFYNGAVTTRVFDPVNGIVQSIGTTRAGVNIQSLGYTWDSLGNLRTRSSAGCAEAFTNDLLNRVRTGTVSGCGAGTSLDVNYDAIGNITTKAGVGTTYTYGAQPHAVSSISGGPVPLSYTYDANGNMETRTRGGVTSTVQWNIANLPTSIQGNSEVSQFSYAPSRARYKQVSTYLGRTETTLYAGGLFERMTRSDNGKIEYRHHIKAGAQTVVTVEEEAVAGRVFRYMHRDHLGSVDAVSDASGGFVTSSFNVHGYRRDSANWLQLQKWSAQSGAIDAQRDKSARGFTDHEMLDNVSLVHMNGRVYDPEIGRFMSVDPVFQFPENAQSLNPYSYVLNNPLSLTDPSGFTACSDTSAGGHGTCTFKEGDKTYTAKYDTKKDGSVAVRTNQPGRPLVIAAPGIPLAGNGSKQGLSIQDKSGAATTTGTGGMAQRNNADYGAANAQASEPQNATSANNGKEPKQTADPKYNYVEKTERQWVPLAEGQKLVGFAPVSPAMVAAADALTSLFPGSIPAFFGGYDAAPLLVNIRLEQLVVNTSTSVFQGDKQIASLNMSVTPTRTLREVFHSSDWRTGSTHMRSEWLMRGPTTKVYPGVDDGMIRSRWREQGVTINSDGVPQFLNKR